jgi:hypothetical protein
MEAYQEKYSKKPSILNLIVITVFILVMIAYAILSLSTNDMLWFWPVFTETPSEITVYCYGEPVNIQSGTRQFNELATTFNESFSEYKNWDSLTMSQLSWVDYQENKNFATLVLTYHEPVRVHSLYKYFSGVNKLVMPLDGRHASSNPVFGVSIQRTTNLDGTVSFSEVPGSGAFHITSKQPVMNYISAEGICALP